MTQRTCAVCDAPFLAQTNTNVCSDACRKARTAERERAYRTAGAAYYVQHLVCVQCDEPFTVTRSRSPSGRCAACHVPKPRLKKPPISTCVWRTQKSPLRVAIESGDTASVLSLLRARCIVNDVGCHIWQGRIADGYAIVNVGGRRLTVHRLVAEAIHGPLHGAAVVHHICADTRCVCPDHVTPVTQLQNIAEMMLRNWYEQRIAALEAALGAAEPSHPLIDTTVFANVRSVA